ncbi:alanine--tRNA ligase [Candidatus Nomurabacteria bacterium]|nr:alanine--tRNA ligase [Candidatus Nomurabacteria bacterium]
MQSKEIRERFLKFFENRGHKIIPSASLVPEGDISVLFTTAGMQQFKPYYSNPENADKDFGNRNITSAQKCLRTNDIDEVGDSTHNTFFEMLGNFSFGGYGRREAIEYAYDFIKKELGLEISYVTIYKGEGIVPKDIESENIWRNLDSNLEVREDGSDVFWGPTGNNGPCGPTTEIYCKNASGEDVEIWNIVFNEYFCDGSREKLDKGEANLKKMDVLGIDTGMGLERLLATVQKKKSIYDTDLFLELFDKIEQFSSIDNSKAKCIVADHIRTTIFLISDGVFPSNTDRGYILRRLLRRAVRYADILGMKHGSLVWLSESIIEKYHQIYPNLLKNSEIIKKEIEKEENKFRETLVKGLKEFEKGIDPFILATTYGFPIELTQELAEEKGTKINLEDFNKQMKAHVILSQTASAGMFKGGLANHNEKTVKLHTAHHLLLAALQDVVNKDIKQRGSNITEERLRIDFVCDHKLTDEEKNKVENLVNEKIKAGLNVVRREMPLAEAEKIGAQMEFGAKYPEMVSVYFIEDEKGAFSKEFCGGPHISNTAELGTFKIQKEEAVSAGVRRIKAVLL